MNTVIETTINKDVNDAVNTSTGIDDTNGIQLEANNATTTTTTTTTTVTEFENVDEHDVNVADDANVINCTSDNSTSTSTSTAKLNPRFKMEEYQYQQRDHHDSLNLSNDVRLCTLLQSLSHHVQKRTCQLSSSISKLESKMQQVDYNVNRVIMLDSMHSDYQSMLFHAAADDDNHKHDYNNINNKNNSGSPISGTSNVGKKSVNNDNEMNQHDEGSKPAIKNHDSNNESGLDQMQKEEDDAIQDGIKALSIFHDPSTGANNTIPIDPTTDGDDVGIGIDNTDYFGIEEEEEDDEDSFYYYESSPGDVFNQRPLPFIIGSVEFLDSVDGGIGGDIVVEEEEKREYDVFEEDDDSDY